MSKLYRSLLWSGLVAAGVAACGDDVTVTPPAPPPAATVHSITVGPNPATIQVGTTLQMTASVNADVGVVTTVTWRSTNTAIATVGASTGLVTAVTAGTVAIEACSTFNTAVCGNATVIVTTTPVTPPPTVTSVSVSPSSATISKPQTGSTTLQLSAAVVGTNGPSQTVTWSVVSSPAGASISATGLLTITSAIAVGAVNVSACSTVAGFTTVCGFSTVTIGAVIPATVSLSSVTWVPPAAAPACAPGPGPAVPVVLTNVSCQIEVTANVNAGDIQLSRIDVVMTNTCTVPPNTAANCVTGSSNVRVMASQTFPGTVAANGEDASLSAPVDITMSISTTQVRSPSNSSANLVPAIFNGNATIQLVLYSAGGAQIASTTPTPVVMNNVDAVIYPTALVNTTNTPAGGFTTGGVTFFSGTQTITGAQYISFSQTVPTTSGFISTVAGCGPSSSTVTGTPTTGITISGVFACAGVQGRNTVSNAAPPVFTYAVATGPDGTPITAPLFFSTVGSAFQLPASATFAASLESRWNLLLQNGAPVPLPTQLPTVGVDNAPPVVTLSTVAFNAAWDQPWINSNTQLLLPFITAVDCPVATPPNCSGVASIAARKVTIAAYTTAHCLAQPDLPDPATTANLAETITSTSTDGQRICGRATDNVGNVGVSAAASNFFGVDVVAPGARYAGSTTATPLLVTPATATVSTLANTTIFSLAANAFVIPATSGPFPAADKWGIEGLDTRSGFNQNGSFAAPQGPALQVFTLLNPANPGTVLAPNGATCPIASLGLGTILSDTWVRSTTTPAIDGTSGACATGQPGYLKYTPTVVDRAGNVGAPTVATRNYAIDEYLAPNITGLGFAAALYTPGTAAPFGFSANDDLELIDGTLFITMTIPSGTGTGLRYPLTSLTPLGLRWDNGVGSLTNVLNGAVASIPYFIFRVDETCSAAATPYASCPAPGGPPAYITAPDATVSADYGAGAGKLPTNVGANVGDVASQVGGAPISAPMLATQFSPSTGISEQWTTADLLSWDLTISGSTATAVHVASTSIVVPYFDTASLWRLNTANEWVLCGSFPAPALTDNGAHRFWTYTLTMPSTGVCTGPTFAAGATRRAMGTKVGAALFTPTR